MAFESGGGLEDWRSAVIIPLYKDKGEKTECSLLGMVGKIYLGIQVDSL